MEQALKERDQARADLDQRWKESNQIKNELNQHKREIEVLRSREDQLKSELELARAEKDQVSTEVISLRRDMGHYKDTIRLKDDEIAFLLAHLSQLSDKLTPALPPSHEEARSKHWWRFWR